MPLLLNFPSFSILLLLFVAIIIILIAYILWKANVSRSGLFRSNCYEDAYRLIPDGVIVLNSEGSIVYINPAAEKMLNCRLRSVMGQSYKVIFGFFHLKTGRILQGVFTENDRSHISCECLLSTTTNLSFPISLNVFPLDIRNKTNNKPLSLLIFQNITERKVIESKISDLEKYDTLTRMLNRRSFEAEVKHLVESTQKHDSKHVLVYFSIDQFQLINDTVGYAGGDSLIIKMVDIIARHTKKNLDIIGRVNEDEFAVVYRERKLATVVKEVRETLVDVEAFKFTSMGKNYPITMSAGFIIIDKDSTSSTRVISEARSACHLAKKGGGNYLSAYKPENNEIEELEGNLEWIMILKDALQNNRFEMHAQPIHPLRMEEYTQPFYHYELLIRLSDDKGNPISPNEFLSAAEYYSMMPTIDRWVVRTVIKKVSKIRDQIPLPVFAINLSGQSLNDASFLDFVLNEVKTSGVDPQMLCFEITEQVAVEDLSLVNSFISSLKSLGSKFSLDDFGTGVSSYGYLRSLDVDYLKIDGSFVKSIVDDEVAKAMVQSINYVGHTMDLKVIAEYVENEEILDLLRVMGVDYGQGYQILRPIPFDEILKQHIVDEEYDCFIES